MKFVSIIILNYNWKQFNKDCIDSVLQQSYQNFEIIFVDNHSTDGSLELVKEEFQSKIDDNKIRIIENKENIWFAWGNNLWVTHANKQSEYICLLNNDTTVWEFRLEELIKWIQWDNKLWAVSSIILDKGYEDAIKEQIFEKKEIFASNIFWELALRRYSEEEFKNRLVYTSLLSWCSLLYKKNIIDRPFEDYYFAYAEDVYLSLYLIRKWYTLAYCLNSVVNHIGSGSFGKEPSKIKLFHGNKNQIINFLVFYSNRQIFFLLPLFIIKEISHIFFSSPLKRIQWKYSARKRIIRNYHMIKKTRMEVQKQSRIDNRKFLEELSYNMVEPNIFCFQFTNFQKRIVEKANTLFSMYIGKNIK